MSDKDRDIPAIPAGVDGTLRRVLEPMREALQKLMGTRGEAGSKAIRWEDLERDGLASASRRKLLVSDAIADAVAAIPPSTSSGTGTGSGSTYTPDLTQPPQPTGLTVTAGFSSIMVEWAAPIYSAGHGHKQTNIYATKQPAGDVTLYTINDAVKVDAAPGALRVATLASELNTKWRVWIRWESIDGVESEPAGGVNGIVVTTGQDVTALLQSLSQKISASQLATTLATRIDLIDAPATTAGSVAAKVKTETDARVAAIAQEVTDRGAAITAGLNAAKAYTESWAYDKLATDQAIAASATTVTSAYQMADDGTLNSAKAYVQGYTYTQASIDSALTTLSNQLTASYTQADTATLSSAKTYADASVSTYAYSKAQTDQAIAYQISQISASAGGNKTYSQPSEPASGMVGGDLWYDSDDGNKPYRYDGAAWQPTTDTRLTNVMAAVATEAEVRASETDWLSAQYSVRVQLTEAGRTVVGGFGIAGTSSPTQGPTIDFGVQADKFWIGAPAGSTGVSDVQPFVVQTADTMVNGVTIPKGVYMDAAYIVNMSAAIARLGTAWIDDAKISALSAGKLSVGDGTIGGPLKSGNYNVTLKTGWLVTPDGVVDFREGSIGGIEIGGDFLRTAGFAYGAKGLYTNLVGDFMVFGDGGRVLNMAAADAQPVLQVGSALSVLADGSATFAGNLQAAGGTFIGQVAAGSLDVEKLSGTASSFTTPGGPFQVTTAEGFTKVKITLRAGGGGAGYGVSVSQARGGGGGQGGLTVITLSDVPTGTPITINVGGAGAGAPTPPQGWNYNVSSVTASAGGNTTAVVSGTTYTAYGGSPGSNAYTYFDGSTLKGAPGVGGTGGSGGGSGANGANGANGGTLSSGGLGGGAGSGYGAGGSANQGAGYAGFATVEMFNPNGVVLRSEWTVLMDHLRTRSPTSAYTWP
ncbi:MAG: DUF1983 domain-containing protein [Proteobacteria bacterium]|nr:DUF1983 domain-containing protein [Pseudomonadota bacterium]